PTNARRIAARRITLHRPGEDDVAVVTDLLDERAHPADDLLAVYLGRWGIERVFQQVTEVFGLEKLIGCSPEATVFQCALCMVLYNVLQILRAQVATAAGQPAEKVSAEQLFVDVQRQMIAT